VWIKAIGYKCKLNRRSGKDPTLVVLTKLVHMDALALCINVPEEHKAKWTAVSMVRTGAVDGCYADGCPNVPGPLDEMTQQEYTKGKHQMLADLQAEVPGIILCGSGGGTMNGVFGASVQNWGKGGSFSTREIPMLQRAVDAGVMFDFSHVDRQEQGEESPSYPGVHTVYIKQTVTGMATVNNPEVLKRIGLGEGGSGTFEVQDSQKYTRVFQWMSEEECQAAGIQLRPVADENEISALVYPPVGLNEDDLMQYLSDNNVDVSKWGEGTARSVAEFSEELVKGESALLKQDNGRIVRVVDIVVLQIKKTTEEGTFVLREIEEKVGEKASALDRLPAAKRRADEHPFASARRMISKYLHMDNNTVTIDPDDVKVSQEEQESTSYPGLLSVYRKRYMTAVVHDLPPSKLDSLA